MQNTVDAIRRGERNAAKMEFAKYATLVLNAHRLQIIANAPTFCTGIDVLCDAISIGIGSDYTKDIEEILAETTNATDLTPLVPIGNMLVCKHLAVIRAHDEQGSLEYSPPPTIYITDKNGEWIASDTDLEHAFENPENMIKLHERRTEQRKNENIPTPHTHAPLYITPQCPELAKKRALRFLKTVTEQDICHFPQFRAVTIAIPSLLDLYAPNLGMILALLQDGGEDTIELFERRYPISADEIIYALRAILPLSTSRDTDTELRRMRAFLRALII